jgi:hypothetical protein
MDRVGVFVDAGYLLAAGGAACCGTSRRADLEVDYAQLVDAVADLVSRGSSLPVLRVYWYDGAPGGVPQSDHLKVAELPGVKLRLGRLTQFGQKGVDSLLLRDLMTLARERAIATAYVIGGDEDLVEGVASAQDMGVRVAVVAVEGASQAQALIHEADAQINLAGDFLAPYFALRQAVVAGSEPELARQAGRDFAVSCSDGMARDQLAALMMQSPRIPGDLDAQLLNEAERSLGPLRDRFDLKVELRAGFWQGISETVASGGEPEASR